MNMLYLSLGVLNKGAFTMITIITHEMTLADYMYYDYTSRKLAYYGMSLVDVGRMLKGWNDKVDAYHLAHM